MKNITKVGLIISGVLIALGVLICGAVLTVYSFNMSVFDTDTKRTAETFTPDGAFSSVDISTSFDDIKITHSSDGSCRIEAYEGGNDGYSVSIDGDVLKIEQQDLRRWYEFINISFGVEKYGIIVYLPEKTYEKMNIVTASGDIDISSISSKGFAITTASGDILASEIISDDMEVNTVSGDMEIESVEGKALEFDSTSGECEIKNITADNLKIKTTSGDITAENTIITKKANVNSTSGCCEFENSDSGEFEFETVSGDIKCELLTAKHFETDTTSGNINVPLSDKSGGLFKAKTTSGNISVEYVN